VTWVQDITAPWTLAAAVGGALAAAFLWWALADLLLATFEVPFGDTLDRWRQRFGMRRDRGDGNADAGATA
jgi:hypothetical protein